MTYNIAYGPGFVARKESQGHECTAHAQLDKVHMSKGTQRTQRSGGPPYPIDDEDQADEARKNVFRKPKMSRQKPLKPKRGSKTSAPHKWGPYHRSTQQHGHVLHEGAEVEDGNKDGEERAPHTRSKIKWHKFQVASYRKVIDHQRVGQERAGGSQNGQGLSRCGREEHTRKCSRDYHLQDTELPIRSIQEAATEGDGRRAQR